MLNREDYLMIVERHKAGVYQKDIAAELGVHPRTVRRALARGSEPLPRRVGQRESKLAAFKPAIDAMLADNVWNASVIFRRLREAGYTGGATLVRDYVSQRRPSRQRTATVRFETLPGQQLQHDWAETRLMIGGRAQRVTFAVNSLGYARAVHVVAMESMDAEHTYEAVIQAFEYFGGVTDQVLVDNQKSAVIDWRDGQPRFNARFRELAAHMGFVPKACRPRRAQTKGKVERMVGYVKGNALCGNLAFDSLAELNAYLRHWCDTVANVRLHSELRERVNVRLNKEQPALTALPVHRFDTAYHLQRQVSLDAFIQYNGCRYSVPGHCVGQPVQVHVTLDGHLTVEHDQQTVAQHTLSTQPHDTIVVSEHHNPIWAALRVSERPLQVYDEVCA